MPPSRSHISSGTNICFQFLFPTFDFSGAPSPPNVHRIFIKFIVFPSGRRCIRNNNTRESIKLCAWLLALFCYFAKFNARASPSTGIMQVHLWLFKFNLKSPDPCWMSISFPSASGVFFLSRFLFGKVRHANCFGKLNKSEGIHFN